MGWPGTTNGDLLQLATAAGLEAFVTVDVNLRVAPDSPLRVLVLRAGSNRLEALMPVMPNLLEKLAALLSRSRDAAGTDPRPGIRIRALWTDSDQPAVRDQPTNSIGSYRQSLTHTI